MQKLIYFGLIINFPFLLLNSCGWQNIAIMTPVTEDIDVMQHFYMSCISDELSGVGPPLIGSNWNAHWTSVLGALRAEKTDVNLKLEDFILNERRKRGLPDLVF